MKITLKNIILIFVLLLALFPLAKAQDYSVDSRRAIKKYEEGVSLYRQQYFAKALEEADNALRIEPAFIEAYLLKAEIYHKQNKTEQEIEAYKNALRINQDFYPMAFYYLGIAEKSIGRYTDARRRFFDFLSYDQLKNKYEKKVRPLIIACNFGIHAMKNPVPFKPKNLGENVNSPIDDYWPSLTADEQTLVFTRSNRKKRTQEDFYISEKKNGQWQAAQNMGAPLNTRLSEGAQSISADGKTMVYAACLREDGLGSCDIYISHKTGNTWSTPKNIGAPVNSRFKETQPSLSADGRTLYFAANRDGTFGGLDIWVSNKQENGRWSMPKNLGDSINTSKDDFSPFIHPDNQSLYFASAGWLGMGGSDLFFSQKINEKWSTPTNMGYPINTWKNEENLVVTATGDLALFSTDRDGKGQDIYEFPLYPSAQPNPVTYVEGVVYAAETQKKLCARFELLNLQSKKTITESHSDPYSGEFLVCLPVNKRYVLNVSKSGYLFYSENFSLIEHNPEEVFVMNIPLQPIKKGKKVVLKNIFFEIDSYKLKKESFIELDKLVKFLEMNNTLKIQINGHTDNQGTDQHNLELSKNRAKAVYDYLIENGIAKERLKYKGFGEQQPIATNETPKGRALNRRTEFEIIE